ncbi:Ref family recombination enhancement nuclease [Arsukibacterium sp.]|uniref:Ref family recombination enhancement nuclease n=1 Tax=Arsukibacterium sp. TaxID=1977258 RepID=UPI002FD8C8F2
MAKKPTKDESRHYQAVLALGCVACRKMGYFTPDCEIHHISNGTMGKKASNYEVIGLCHTHHRTGGYGVAVHAGRKAWEAIYGTEQELLNDVMSKV